jgi:hypothetical protein
VTTTDQPVKRMRKELSQHGKPGIAAAKAGVCRPPAAKSLRAGKRPSELKAVREWRTRPDPFAEVWPAVEARRREAPGLWVRTLFEEWQEQYGERFQPGPRRTLYRRVPRGRALHGDDTAYEVFFPQQHRPGEAAHDGLYGPGGARTEASGRAVRAAALPWGAALCERAVGL